MTGHIEYVGVSCCAHHNVGTVAYMQVWSRDGDVSLFINVGVDMAVYNFHSKALAKGAKKGATARMGGGTVCRKESMNTVRFYLTNNR